MVPRTPLIPLVGSFGQPRHGRWHPALQEHMLGFFPGQEPQPPYWGDPVVVFTFFSFYSSTVLFFGIPFLGNIILVRTTISSPGFPGVKSRSFRRDLLPQRDNFVFHKPFAAYSGDSPRRVGGILGAQVCRNPQGWPFGGVADLFYLYFPSGADIPF